MNAMNVRVRKLTATNAPVRCSSAPRLLLLVSYMPLVKTRETRYLDGWGNADPHQQKKGDDMCPTSIPGKRSGRRPAARRRGRIVWTLKAQGSGLYLPKGARHAVRRREAAFTFVRRIVDALAVEQFRESDELLVRRARLDRLRELDGLVEHVGHGLEVGFFQASRRHGGGTRSNTARRERDTSPGTAFLFSVIWQTSPDLLDLRAGHALGLQIPEHQMVVRAAGGELVAVTRQPEHPAL